MDVDGTGCVALDTTSAFHPGPTSFGEGCVRKADDGPKLLGAQEQETRMGSIATVPMAVDSESEQTKLLKPDIRLGDAASKPTFSLLEAMDKAKSGVRARPGDLSEGAPLAARNHAPVFNAKAFKSTTEARAFAASAFANEQQAEEELAPSPRASGSGGPAAAAARRGPAQLAATAARGVDRAREQVARKPALRRDGQEIALHPESRVEDMRARSRGLGEPIYGAKNKLWTGLGDAERRITAHHDRLKELERRLEQSVQGAPVVAPRQVAGPAGPTPGKRAARELLRLTRAEWREAWARGIETTRPRNTLTFDQNDTGKVGDEELPAAGIFATALVMADRGTPMFNAFSTSTKVVADYAVAGVSGFAEGNQPRDRGRQDGLNMVEEAQKKLSKSVKLE
ncbi:unnamed protein product, partial [Prorocentrum cordatum]